MDAFRAHLLLVSVLVIGCQGYKNAGDVGQCRLVTASRPKLEYPTFKTQLARFREREAPVLEVSQVRESQQLRQRRFMQLGRQVLVHQGEILTGVVRRDCAHQTSFARGALVASASIPKRLLSRPTEAESEVTSVPVEVRETLPVSELEVRAGEDLCVVMVSDRKLMKPFARPNDRLFSRQAHLASIRAATAWDTFYGPTGIRREIVIAIIDTGVSQRHDDLREAMWVNRGEIPGNNVDDDQNGYVDDVNGYNFRDDVGRVDVSDRDSNYHGTHVAGLAAARSNNRIGVAGVMGVSSKVMSLNVFGKNSGAFNEDIENAIRYAADNGAHIINLSLGGEGEVSSTTQALRYAVSRGVTVFAAAGNSATNSDETFFSPAGNAQNISGMISVASVDTDRTILSSFSNYGARSVEYSAPGNKGILSTIPWNDYDEISGTSMASPVAAGAGALTSGFVWSRTGVRPTPATVEDLLLRAARRVRGLRNSVLNGGTLDLQSLAELLNQEFAARRTPRAGGAPALDRNPSQAEAPRPDDHQNAEGVSLLDCSGS